MSMIDVDEPAGPAEVRWVRTSCHESEAHLQRLGDGRFVYSSLTDLGGAFGKPRIETIWADEAHPTIPVLKNIRHPDLNGGKDVEPCEHFLARRI